MKKEKEWYVNRIVKALIKIADTNLYRFTIPRLSIIASRLEKIVDGIEKATQRSEWHTKYN